MKTKKTVDSSLTIDIQTGLSLRTPHTERAYTRHITDFLSDNISIPIDLASVKLDTLAEALDAKKVKGWIDQLKERGLGKQSLQQAHAALVWLSDYIGGMYEDQGFDLIITRLKNIKVPDAVGK